MNADKISNALTVIAPIKNKKINSEDLFNNLYSRLTKRFILNRRLYFLSFLCALICVFLGACAFYKEPFYCWNLLNRIFDEEAPVIFVSLLFVCFFLSFSLLGKAVSYIVVGLSSSIIGMMIGCLTIYGFIYKSVVCYFAAVVFLLIIELFATGCYTFVDAFSNGLKNGFNFNGLFLQCGCICVYIYILYILFTYLINNFMIG